MKMSWLACFLFLSNQCVSDQRTQDVPGQLHESLKASSPNEKPFSPTVVKPHARKLAKASRRSCERPAKNERTFEQPPYTSNVFRWSFRCPGPHLRAQRYVARSAVLVSGGRLDLMPTPGGLGPRRMRAAWFRRSASPKGEVRGGARAPNHRVLKVTDQSHRVFRVGLGPNVYT